MARGNGPRFSLSYKSLIYSETLNSRGMGIAGDKTFGAPEFAAEFNMICLKAVKFKEIYGV